MKLSVMFFMYHSGIDQGKYTPEEVVKAFKDAGADAIETMNGWQNSSPENWKKTLAAMAELGLVHSCWDIGADLVQTNSADRQKVIDTCKTQIEYARDVLHAPTVLVYGSNVKPGMSIEDGIKLYGETLGEVADFGAQAGINVTLEDFDPHPRFVCSAKSCMTVLEIAGDNAKLCFDTGNFLNAGDLPAEIYPLVKDKIAHVHVKEKARRLPDDKPGNTATDGVQYKSALIGDGAAQIALVQRFLKEDGYKGYLSVEAGSNRLEEATYGVRFLKDRL